MTTRPQAHPMEPTRSADLVPIKDEGPTANTMALASTQSKHTHFEGANHAVQALRVIEGERKAAKYLACLQAQQADPDELALIIAQLYGATLRGFCRMIEKALGVAHA